MRGERIEAAVCAAEVFAEALARVGAPFIVAGFQDELFILATQDATAEQARRGIADAAREVAGTRPGGRNQPQHNDDGPCLLTAAKVLRSLQARQRVLVVLSDGAPAGRRSDEADLLRAVQTLSAAGDIDLIGMGIGEGATHVARFYPRHVVVPAVAQLPEALIRVLAA
jgi:cobalamin biosynthesis protein CobT